MEVLSNLTNYKIYQNPTPFTNYHSYGDYYYEGQVNYLNETLWPNYPGFKNTIGFNESNLILYYDNFNPNSNKFYVPYEFESDPVTGNSHTRKEKNVIKKVLNLYRKYTCINFVDTSSTSPSSPSSNRLFNFPTSLNTDVAIDF